MVGPFLAAARLNGRLTAAVAVYAVAGAVLLGELDGIGGTHDHLMRTLLVAAAGAFATFTAYGRARRERELVRMTEVAEVAQRAILRPIPPAIGGVAFATRYHSATSEALIGGDLYDTALTPFGLRLVIGDVKGKGLESVQLAATVLGHFRETAFTESDMVSLAVEVDRRLAGLLRVEDFVTAVFAEFAPGEVRLANCGHHPPLRVGRNLDGNLERKLDLLTPSRFTPPLGLEPKPVLHRVDLRPGERMLFYTDGLVEARDRRGTMFEFTDEVLDCLTQPSLNQALDDLLGLVLAHTNGRLDDDLALVLGEPLGIT